MGVSDETSKHFRRKFAKILSNFDFFFFRAQAVEEALRKDRDCPAEKQTPKREREGVLAKLAFFLKNLKKFVIFSIF